MKCFDALVLLSLLALLAAPLSAGGVVVVDPGGGPGYVLLQDAINAAQPGDIVLIKPGDYVSTDAGAVSWFGKALSLVADGPGVTLPGLIVQGVPAGQVLLVRGIQFGPEPAQGSNLARIRVGGAGSLWMEACNSLGADGWLQLDTLPKVAQHGLLAQDLDFVLLARSDFAGGHGLDASILPGGEVIPASFGGAGVRIEGARMVAVHGVHARGGAGGDGEPIDVLLGANGGAGIATVLTRGMIQTCQFFGGDEGAGNSPGATSGAGAQLVSTDILNRGFYAEAGAVQGEGTQAPALALQSAEIIDVIQPPCSVRIDSPVREFETAHVRVDGDPGMYFLFLSAGASGNWQPKFSGVSTIDAALPAWLVVLGPTDMEDKIDLYAPMPALPVGEDGVVLFAQLVMDQGGPPVLGSASSLVWVSAAY